MNKTISVLIAIICCMQLNAQVYLKPIITPVTPGNCDASVTVIPYGGTPPYSIEWFDNESSLHPSSGLTANNLCPGIIKITIFDANCFEFEAFFTITSDPEDQIYLDTLIITNPTTGNSDGSVQVFLSNLPTTYNAFWNTSGSGGGTTQTLFTGLDEDLYRYGISTTGAIFEFSIPLFISPLTPCGTFNTIQTVSPFTSYYERSPNCDYIEPPLDSLSNDSTGSDSTLNSFCNGSVGLYSYGDATGDYFHALYHQYDNSYTLVFAEDSATQFYGSLCRGAYTAYTSNSDNISESYNNVTSIFIQDSLDTTYYWNIPGSIPTNTDTLVTDALNIPVINYGMTADTVFISSVNEIGAEQYEIVTCLIQQPDTFYMYTTEFLDTAYNYLFDITFFEGDSLLCDVNNAMRHVIYFEWPIEEEPCTDSILICHIPPGNPGNTHSIMIPCEDLQDHLNHGDEIGECDRIARYNTESKTLQLFPNPFEEQFMIKSTSTIQKIEMFAIDGKQILSLVANTTSITVDTKDLFPSTYFVKIYFTDGSTENSKLIKIKR